MHLPYLDDSGSTSNAAEDYLVLGGIAIFESQAAWITHKLVGTRWGTTIRNLAETPLFVDSRASRVVQLADHISYAVFRRYNAGDTSYFDIIASKFDSAGGTVHGLNHKQTYNPTCMWVACHTRRDQRP